MSDGGLDIFALALKITTDGGAEAESALGRIGEKGTALSATMKGVAATVGLVMVAFLLLEKASEFLRESVSAGAEREQVFVRMGVAVQNAGVSFTTAKPAIDSMLESLSEHSTFRVDELGSAFTRLVQLTGNVGGSMSKMAMVANFAAGRNIDLETAANLVGRAMNGNAIMLNRMLGLHGTAAEALATLTQRYKDNASALADTAGGVQQQATNAMHEFQTELGDAISKQGGLTGATASWRDGLRTATTWVVQHKQAIGDLVAAGIKLGAWIADIVAFLAGVFVNAWIGAQRVMILFAGVVSSIGPTIELMVGLVIHGITFLIDSIAKHIPFLADAIEPVLGKVRAAGEGMIKQGTLAIDANADAVRESIRGLDEQADVIEKHAAPALQKHKEWTDEDTKALLAQVDALTTLSGMNRLTESEFLLMASDYRTLTNLVNSHTLKLADQAAAEQKLDALRKAAPVLSGANIAFILGPTKSDAAIAAEGLAGVSQILDAANKKMIAQNKDRALAYAVSGKKAWDEQAAALSQSIQDAVTTDFIQLGANIAGTIADSIGDAFTGGLAKAGQTAMKGLGNIFSAIGKHMLLASKPMMALSKAMTNPVTGGWALAAAGVILMALGAAMGAIANGSGGGGDGGGGSGYSVAGAGTATNAAQITNITLSSNATAVGSKVTPAVAVHATFIGSNDPTIHQPVIDLINTATGRGMKLNTG